MLSLLSLSLPLPPLSLVQTASRCHCRLRSWRSRPQRWMSLASTMGLCCPLSRGILARQQPRDRQYRSSLIYPCSHFPCLHVSIELSVLVSIKRVVLMLSHLRLLASWSDYWLFLSWVFNIWIVACCWRCWSFIWIVLVFHFFIIVLNLFIFVFNYRKFW